MVLISNNCLAGFVYQKILKREYNSPTIFTLIEPDEYVSMIENFENINFENWELKNTSKELSNNFEIVIDDKYHLQHHHFYFDKKYDKPTKIHSQYVDIHYNKIWEYICERYVKHIKRMKGDTDFRFLYLEPNLKCERLKELPEILKRKKLKGLIFTKLDDISGNEWCKVINCNYNSPDEVAEKFKKEISEFCL